ncbi:MAG: hypothetical protein OXC28_08270 [Defluviicoccus sp.]|nr:hypothetical protein [Defluviicoccus sp.]
MERHSAAADTPQSRRSRPRKGCGQRDAGRRRFTFQTCFPGRVLTGRPGQAIERIHALSDIVTTRIGMPVDFGSAPRVGIMRPPEIFGRDVLPHAGGP